MTSRERVRLALDHVEPDRVPWDCSFNIYTYRSLLSHLGIPLPACWVHNVNSSAYPDERVLEVLQADVIHIGPGTPARVGQPDTSREYYTDEWGVRFRRVTYGRGVHSWELAEHPLATATARDLLGYPWPDPSDPDRVAGLGEKARRIHDTTGYAIMLHLDWPPLTRAFYLCGLQRLMEGLIADKPFVHALLGRITELSIELARRVIREAGSYADIVRFAGDDIGTQRGPLVSPRTFDEMIRPYWAAMFREARAELDRCGSRAVLCIHSDGDIHPFIASLIDMGVGMINPVQPCVPEMDHGLLKARFGRRLCFHGGLDIQKTLPLGSPQDVIEEVRRVMRSLGPGGGFVLAPTNYIQRDTPPANVLAIRDAVVHYGRYPLDAEMTKAGVV